MKPDIKLHPYQQVGVGFIKDHKYVLIGDEMGLGKTVQAIAAFEEKLLTVVVCPAMLRSTWVGEIKKFTTLSSKIVSGQAWDVSRIPRVLIVSYEGLKNIPTDLKPNAVVFDECHYLKNPRAARTKTAHEFIFETRPELVIGLSGTPIRNNVGEFYSILRLLSYSPSSSNGIPLAEKSQYAFSLKFSQPITKTIAVAAKDQKSKRRSIEITEFKGLRNKELLRKYLKGKYIRRTSKSVLDLPPLISKKVRLAEKDSVTNKELLAGYLQWIKDGGGKLGEHFSQLKVQSAMEKVPHTCKYLLDILEQEKKVVVFSDHVQPLKTIKETILKAKISCGILTGETSNKLREEHIEQFQNGNLRVLLCSIRAASTGLTLTASRHLVFNDLSWVPADLEQARKRIHRIGQENKCVIHYIIQGEMDDNLQEKILEKSKLMKEIL